MQHSSPNRRLLQLAVSTLWLIFTAVNAASAQAAGQPTDLQATCQHGAPTVAVQACTDLLRQGNLDDKSKATTYINRGNAYDELGDSERALGDYDSALAINPRDALAHRNKGATLERQRRLREAGEEFDKAIALKPDYALAYASRADNLAARGVSAATEAEGGPLLERAVADYDQAIRLGLRDVNVYRSRGRAHAVLGQLDAAIADFTSVVELAGDFASYLLRAAIYAERGDFDRAAADLDQASKLASDERQREAVRQLREQIAQRRK